MTLELHVPETASSLLLDRADTWSAAITKRHSRRSYDGRRVDEASLDALQEVCINFRPYADARVVLLRSPQVDIFHGIAGSYGKVVHAPHVLAVIADENSHFSHAHAGYTGEAAILEATSLGLDTCWIGGLFSPRRVGRLVELTPTTAERVVAVSPVGHAVGPEPSGSERLMRKLAKSHGRKPLAFIAPGSEMWPGWALAAVEAARLAPSAMNRQPWRFRVAAGALIISADSPVETPKVTKALDCGIAMLHAELGALSQGVRGRWVGLHDRLDIARFEPTAREDATTTAGTSS